MSKMERSKIKDLLDDALTFKWLMLGIILYLYGSKSKEQLYYFSAQAGSMLNKWDLLYSFASNIYLILYLILPILLYRSVSIIIADFEFILLIRLRSYRNWVYQTLNKFLQTFSVIIIIWISVILLLLIGSPPFDGWSPFSELGASFSETQILEKYLDTPVLALVLHMLLFTLSVICIHLLLAVIYVLTKRKGIIVCTAILIWVYGSVSFKLLPDSAFLFSLPNYLMLHAGAAGFENTWAPIGIIIGVFFIMIWILERIDLNHSSSKKLTPNWTYTLFTVFTVIALWSGTQVSLAETIWDQFFFMFRGSSQIGFSLKAFLSYFVIYFGFIYLIQLFLQRELRETGYYKLIRYRSVFNWFWSWFKKIIIRIVFYLFALSICSFILSSLTGLSISFRITVADTNSIYEMLYHFFVNGFLQLLFYTLFVFIIAWISTEAFYSLAGISVLSTFMFPGLNTKLVIPSGLNSLGNILNGHSPYMISLVLAFWVIAEIIVVAYILNKRDMDL